MGELKSLLIERWSWTPDSFVRAPTNSPNSKGKLMKEYDKRGGSNDKSKGDAGWLRRSGKQRLVAERLSLQAIVRPQYLVRCRIRSTEASLLLAMYAPAPQSLALFPFEATTNAATTALA